MSEVVVVGMIGDAVAWTLQRYHYILNLPAKAKAEMLMRRPRASNYTNRIMFVSIVLVRNVRYLIELCSGECSKWKLRLLRDMWGGKYGQNVALVHWPCCIGMRMSNIPLLQRLVICPVGHFLRMQR